VKICSEVIGGEKWLEISTVGQAVGNLLYIKRSSPTVERFSLWQSNVSSRDTCE
jgi:hypothetical protein